MSGAFPAFDPVQPLLTEPAHDDCRACITIPARNEAHHLSRCLDGFTQQIGLDGAPLPYRSFEVLLLLNNCSDNSAAIARMWQEAHPRVPLHVVQRIFGPAEAHVGTARRLLMDTAWSRLRNIAGAGKAILSTDADTVVAPDWIALNLHALEHGADVVGGSIDVLPEELAALPPRVQRCYQQDRRYASLVARLEDLFDPQRGDPWPRHLDHFGSSLACRPEAYVRAGGMPAVSPLEDEAFIDRVRRAGLCLRHEPRVRVYTSARLQGRAEIGLAGQFRLWSRLPGEHAQLVPSASFLEHRFRFMRRLRRIHDARQLDGLKLPSEWWQNTFEDALRTESTCPGFLGAVYCDILIREAFQGCYQEPVQHAIEAMQQRIDAAADRTGHHNAERVRPSRVRQPNAVLAASVQ